MSDSKVDIARRRIEPLHAKNYYSCSQTMRILMRGKGLWKILAGEEESPGLEDPTVLTKYERGCDVALTDILLSIDASCLHTIITLEDPKECTRVWPMHSLAAFR